MLAGLPRKDMVLSFRDYSRSKWWSLQARLPTFPVERDKRTWETYHVASHLSICCRMERLLRFASPLLRSRLTCKDWLDCQESESGENTCRSRESSYWLAASQNEPTHGSTQRATSITNLIEYIDLHEGHYRLRVQLKLSSYRLVVTTRTYFPLDLYLTILLFQRTNYVTLLVGS
jgi:hypothetical protein